METSLLATAYAQNHIIRVALIIRAALELAGIVFIALTIVSFKRKFSFEHNTRIVIMNFFGFVLLLSLFGAINDIRSIINVFSDGPYEWLLSSCAYARTPLIFCAYGVSYSMVIICVERLVATIFYKSYYDFTVALGFILLALQNTIPMLTTLFLLYDLDFDTKAVRCSLTTKYNCHRMAVISESIICSEFIAIIVFHCLLIVNKHLLAKSSLGALAQRYQLNENIRSLSLLLPLIYTHGILNNSCWFLHSFEINFGINPMETNYVFKELTNILYLYGCILPLLFWLQSNLMQRNKNKILVENQVLGSGFKNIYRKDRAKDADELRRKHLQVITKQWYSNCKVNIM